MRSIKNPAQSIIRGKLSDDCNLVSRRSKLHLTEYEGIFVQQEKRERERERERGERINLKLKRPNINNDVSIKLQLRPSIT